MVNHVRLDSGSAAIEVGDGIGQARTWVDDRNHWRRAVRIHWAVIFVIGEGGWCKHHRRRQRSCGDYQTYYHHQRRGSDHNREIRLMMVRLIRLQFSSSFSVDAGIGSSIPRSRVAFLVLACPRVVKMSTINNDNDSHNCRKAGRD